MSWDYTNEINDTDSEEDENQHEIKWGDEEAASEDETDDSNETDSNEEMDSEGEQVCKLIVLSWGVGSSKNQRDRIKQKRRVLR